MKNARDLDDEQLRNLFYYVISTGPLELDEQGQLTKESVKLFKKLCGEFPWDAYENIISSSEGSWVMADITQEYLHRFSGIQRRDSPQKLIEFDAKNDRTLEVNATRPPGRPSRASKAANIRKTIRFTEQEIQTLEDMRRVGESFGEMVRRLLGLG